MRLANDGKCFVLSKAIDGAAAPPADLDRARPDVVFGATLGTGVGGGIVVDGRVLTGQNGAATEWSHTRCLLRQGEHAPYVCVCGHADCIEAFTSDSALIAWYHTLGGGDVDGAESGRRAVTPDDVAAQAFALYKEALARALASVVNMLDPRAMALGGGCRQPAVFANVPRAVGALDGPEGPARAAGPATTATRAAFAARRCSGRSPVDTVRSHRNGRGPSGR